MKVRFELISRVLSGENKCYRMEKNVHYRIQVVSV